MNIYRLLLVILTALPFYGNAQTYNPTDTLDEVDYIQLRDTLKMTRLNTALDEGSPYYGIDYVIDDRYRVSHEHFKNSLWDQLYMGGGAGCEFLVPNTEGFPTRQLTTLNFLIGKQFTPFHSLRLSLGGTMSYKEDSDFWFARGTAKLDYLYDLSTHVSGYSSARRLNVSLLAGIGGNVVNTEEEKLKFVPDLHVGMQFRIFTGPRCFINIEPYASISSDQLDINAPNNWRNYDLAYGINLNFQYYLNDPLSAQSKLALLNRKRDDALMVDRSTVDTWRTPWFFEATSGPAFSRVPGRGTAMGNATSLSVGRWFSPVLGLRLSAATRSMQFRFVPSSESVSGIDELYHSHYDTGRIEFLFNPFGFSRNFSWDNQFGASIIVGTEMGSANMHDMDGKRDAYFGQSVTAGLHLWTKLTDDLQFFVEPRFSHNIYTRVSQREGYHKRLYDNIPSIDLGLTMMIRSEKFHELDEFDDVQNFMHSYVRGFRVGMAGGLTVLHLRDADYGVASANWNATAYAEFRFSHLHSIRAMAQFMPIKCTNYSNYINNVSDIQHNLLIGSLDYQVSLTNLLSGTLRHRWCELEAYAGPSLGCVMSTSGAPAGYFEDNSIKWGFNGGLKLSKHIWNGISLVAMPTIYMLRGIYTPGANTVSISGFRMYQTLSLGIQYKIGSLHRNATVVRMRKLRSDGRWERKQQEEQRKAEQKLKRKNEKKQRKYQLTTDQLTVNN